MSNFKEITITTSEAVCAFCHKPIKRGALAIGKFKREKETRFQTVASTYLCDAVCLSDYQEKRGSAVNKMLNRLSTQFN